MIVTAGMILIVWSLLPLCRNTYHVGTNIGLCLGLFDLLSYFLFPYLLYRICLYAVTLILGLITIGMVLACFHRKETDTILVLGAHFTSASPSRIMKTRVDAACRWLKEHPDGKAVLSGGQTRDEPYPEAEEMARLLKAEGIDETRLIKEEQSLTTMQNFQYSSALIHEPVTVVTSEFHLFRSFICARKYGMKAYSLPCRTPLIYLCIYWLREMAALADQTIHQ
jgi:uncharacterized SAM-binding protein YcdF (DUF218 family)